ncbi:MAG: hypothetical protein JXB39_06795, partial [Deltaproteobacteria bacterium]|nr:hypothetical protein [Deltaproteobacteria bacterium]
MRSWLPLILSVGLLCTACGPSADKPTSPGGTTEDIGEVLATVGDMPIGEREFEKAAARAVPKDGDALSLDERKEVLDRLIADKILY